MKRFARKLLPNSHTLPGRDEGKILYNHTALNLLQLYFFTGFLANFEELVNINNLILALLLACVWLSKDRRPPLFSPLIILYGALTALSLGSLFWWMPEAGFPQGARTMLITLLAMIACRLPTVPGLFERSILLNTLPFALLIPLGASFDAGRFNSTFLNENLLGSALPFAFAVGANALWEQRYNWKTFGVLFPPFSFMLYSARRSMLLFFISASALLIFMRLKKDTIRSKQFILNISILVFSLTVVLPIMVERQAGRFGDDFQMGEHLSSLITGDAKDRSSLERRGYIELAFYSTANNWFGFGNANFPYVVRNYGPMYLSLAGHPHSGLADALITAGYPGLILYSLILFYLIRIGHKSPLMCLCLVWLGLSFFLEANINNRILWPLLAIAERELQLGKLLSTKANVSKKAII